MTSFMHKPSVAGQSIVDRALAAKHTVSGSGVAKVVCKATTEEVMGPKRKHLDYLLHCTNDANVSIPQMANLLIERTQNTSWVVVYKALVTVHNLMNYGNERFTQYLASNNSHFNLTNFGDRSSTLGHEMSAFVRRYARYLNSKASSYRQMAFDFCKVKRGKEDGFLRTLPTEKLLKTLPVIHAQLETLVEFDATANDLTNGVINGSFMLMFKDLIRLFACYNDGIINLLEKFFDMNKKQCREALDIYKKFLARTDRVCAFLKVAENVGIDKGDIPDLAKAPSSLLEALEQHLSSLEATKKSGVIVIPKPAEGVSAVISSYTTAAQKGAAPGAGTELNQISELERAQLLAEEQRQLEQLKQQRLKQQQGSSSNPPTAASAAPPKQFPGAVATPFAHASPTAMPRPTGASATPQKQAPPVGTTKDIPDSFAEFADSYRFEQRPSEDLLSLNLATPANGFGANAAGGQAGFGGGASFGAGGGFGDDDGFGAMGSGGFGAAATNGGGFAAAGNNPFGTPAFVGGMGSGQGAAVQQSSPWGSPANFPSGQKQNTMPPPSDFGMFGGILQPTTGANKPAGGALTPSPSVGRSPVVESTNSSAASMSGGGVTAGGKQDKLIRSDDIDSSLASLAGNLGMKSTFIKKSEHQWKGETGEKKLTGGGGGASVGWGPAVSQPMGAGQGGVAWGQTQPPMAGAYQSPMMTQQYPMVIGMQQGPMMGGYMMQPQPMMMVAPTMAWPQAQPPLQSSVAFGQTPQSAQTKNVAQPNDPFGLL